MGEPKLVAFFEALDLQVDDAWTLFKLLDSHESGLVEVEEFVEGCPRLRGSARSLDIARMMYENRWIMNKLTKLAADTYGLHAKLGELQSQLSSPPSRHQTIFIDNSPEHNWECS